MKDTWNMTPDEARKYILQNWFDVDKFECGDKEYTAMAIAVEALEATKWHYPSKGEYPPEELYVLCELLDGTHEVGKYCPSKYKEYQEYEPPWDFGDYLEDYIKCWQYIVPPKEE